MKKISLFDQDLLVRDFVCSSSKDVLYPSDVSLRLYIKMTDCCNADCKFCANGTSKDFGEIDFKKLKFVIRYLLDKNILNGISITGGEAMVNPTKLNALINLIFDIDDGLEVCISTNGHNLRNFAYFDQVNKLESIHISRHHYDDVVNKEIFLSDKIADRDDILYLQERLDDKKIININTMVMRDYINSLPEIKKMLDFVGDIGIYKNGFVSLMKCNDYAREQFINFNDIFNNLDDSFFMGHHFYARSYCECCDGLYLTKNNKLVEFYARMVKECSPSYTNQLVYTSDNKVKDGFNGKVLYK